MGPPLCRTQKKDIFWCSNPTLVQSGEGIPEMYFWFILERRDFETHITDQTLLSVMAVRMWSFLTLILTKCKSLTVPLTFSMQKSAVFLHTINVYRSILT